jgi:hypothetical protein
MAIRVYRATVRIQRRCGLEDSDTRSVATHGRSALLTVCDVLLRQGACAV